MRARRLAKIFYAITVNLTSGWLGILVVSPGLFGFTSITEFWEQLRRNVPLAMIGVGMSYWLLKWSES